MKTSHVLVISSLLFLIFTCFSSPPSNNLSPEAWKAVGLIIFLTCLWITEIIPLPVTALLPLIFAPLMGISPFEKLTRYYGDAIVFLFLAGFLLSIAVEKTNLHKRIALQALAISGHAPARQIGGIMLVTGFLSMWMSNTATAAMMLPIVLSSIDQFKKQAPPSFHSSFSTAALLAMAFSASIGGMATLIGTPPNAMLAAYLNNHYQMNIGFSEWMMIGTPISLTLLFIGWIWLTRVRYSFHTCTEFTVINTESNPYPKFTHAEKIVSVLFVATAAAWIARTWLVKITGLPLSDASIALFSACLLFIWPINKKGHPILVWQDTQKLPWGILLLFGGGLALAAIMDESGLAKTIALHLQQFTQYHATILVLSTVLMVILLSEVSSNTAATALLLPLLGPISFAQFQDPYVLTLTAALAASAGFMLPVATPPNSIVFASGELKVKDMIQSGCMMDMAAALLIWTTVCLFVIP